jgi:hypothetical protein
MKPKNIKNLQGRARKLRTSIIDSHTVVVESTTTSTASHVVTIHYDSEGTIHTRCTCPWAMNGGIACSHVIAALEALAGKRGRALSFWTDPEEARRQKRRLFYLSGSRRADRENSGIWITSRSAA